MNIDASKVALCEGTLAVRFLDEDEDEPAKGEEQYASPVPSGSMPYEGCLAQVVSVGPKVAGVKVGSIVVTRPWARDGMKLGDATVIDAHSVVGTLKS